MQLRLPMLLLLGSTAPCLAACATRPGSLADSSAPAGAAGSSDPRGGGQGDRDAGKAEEERITVEDLNAGDALIAGRAALDAGDPTQATVLLGRAARSGTDAQVRDALLGLAEAHVALRDYAAAARVHASLLARGDLDRATRIALCFAKGALEAELEAWEASAADYGRALELGPPEPSRQVEALVRRGYALFQLDRLDEARSVLGEADRVWLESQRDQSERFPSLYFVGMGRFYQAAISHRRFLDAPIRLPMAQMKADFDRKLELLDATQRAYNETIAVKHPFWVSAAGFQLGALFERFYVDVSRSPVPAELDEKGRQTYERELDAQLRPAIEKAMWVHEQNLAAARRLGYATEFVARSEEALERLRRIGLAEGDFRALLQAPGTDEASPRQGSEGVQGQGGAGAGAGGRNARGGAGSLGQDGGGGGDLGDEVETGDLGAGPPPFVPPMRPL